MAQITNNADLSYPYIAILVGQMDSLMASGKPLPDHDSNGADGTVLHTDDTEDILPEEEHEDQQVLLAVRLLSIYCTVFFC
jgi:hypothetical protein